MSKRFGRKTILRALFSIVLLLFGALAIYAYSYVNSAASGQTVALAAMAQPEVSESDGVITFTPTSKTEEIGVIFYQGGLVEADAYAPLTLAFSEAGYQVFMPRMPFNLAVLQPDFAQTIIDKNPQINNWAIGGHSLGAGMAAVFALENPDSVEGLFLYGFYPNESTDMSTLALPVLSVYGTLDGLATVEEVFSEEAQAFYPPDVEFVAIDGGNHAQFGDYGAQDGDIAATISAETQRQLTIDATLNFLASLTTEAPPTAQSNE